MLHIRDVEGQTPIECSRSKGHVDVANEFSLGILDEKVYFHYLVCNPYLLLPETIKIRTTTAIFIKFFATFCIVYVRYSPVAILGNYNYNSLLCIFSKLSRCHYYLIYMKGMGAYKYYLDTS